MDMTLDYWRALVQSDESLPQGGGGGAGGADRGARASTLPISLGFRGNANDYHDPDNSYLNRVIERRLGIPVTLSVLYLEIAGQVGLPASGIGFPGHFLVRHDLPGGALVVDVFAGARVLSQEELEYRLLPYAAGDSGHASRLLPARLAAATPRAILARMLHNLRAIHAGRGDAVSLRAVERRLAVLAA